ncbi:uncharacterized protein C8Q71DRAFT_119544 [Rhodofomes roseus]|uniref:RING-type domain-containing protein n=1 Tax=Rhodofomes roseus TaxID=34475 RepID=A0ABQ8KE70_9APHY|nr:uncharacterized protein C8Q71DRAFT_119544 [Rhodofomes roseus]KAH9835429.1 hypothetical protein C8Q71DRAFT_119544 [Rhodofomes roseus]
MVTLVANDATKYSIQRRNCEFIMKPCPRTPLSISRLDLDRQYSPVSERVQESNAPYVHKERGSDNGGLEADGLSEHEDEAPHTSPPPLIAEVCSATVVEHPIVPPAPQSISWHCRICTRDPCDEPTATICGHVFCYQCIIREISEKMHCPVCGRLFLLRLHATI